MNAGKPNTTTEPQVLGHSLWTIDLSFSYRWRDKGSEGGEHPKFAVYSGGRHVLVKFAARGTQFTLNDRPVFLRGTLECSVWPLTGYPPTDVPAWQRIYRIMKAHGLNHIRFHSWCPPEAALEAISAPPE